MPYQHFQIPCSGGEVQSGLNRLLQERSLRKVGKQFQSEPEWIGSNPDLKIYYGSLRGCWPTISEVEDAG